MRKLKVSLPEWLRRYKFARHSDEFRIGVVIDGRLVFTMPSVELRNRKTTNLEFKPVVVAIALAAAPEDEGKVFSFTITKAPSVELVAQENGVFSEKELSDMRGMVKAVVDNSWARFTSLADVVRGAPADTYATETPSAKPFVTFNSGWMEFGCGSGGIMKWEDEVAIQADGALPASALDMLARAADRCMGTLHAAEDGTFPVAYAAFDNGYLIVPLFNRATHGFLDFSAVTRFVTASHGSTDYELSPKEAKLLATVLTDYIGAGKEAEKSGGGRVANLRARPYIREDGGLSVLLSPIGTYSAESKDVTAAVPDYAGEAAWPAGDFNPAILLGLLKPHIAATKGLKADITIRLPTLRSNADRYTGGGTDVGSLMVVASSGLTTLAGGMNCGGPTPTPRRDASSLVTGLVDVREAASLPKEGVPTPGVPKGSQLILQPKDELFSPVGIRPLSDSGTIGIELDGEIPVPAIVHNRMRRPHEVMVLDLKRDMPAGEILAVKTRTEKVVPGGDATHERLYVVVKTPKGVVWCAAGAVGNPTSPPHWRAPKYAELSVSDSLQILAAAGAASTDYARPNLQSARVEYVEDMGAMLMSTDGHGAIYAALQAFPWGADSWPRYPKPESETYVPERQPVCVPNGKHSLWKYVTPSSKHPRCAIARNDTPKRMNIDESAWLQLVDKRGWRVYYSHDTDGRFPDVANAVGRSPMPEPIQIRQDPDELAYEGGTNWAFGHHANLSVTVDVKALLKQVDDVSIRLTGKRHAKELKLFFALTFMPDGTVPEVAAFITTSGGPVKRYSRKESKTFEAASDVMNLDVLYCLPRNLISSYEATLQVPVEAPTTLLMTFASPEVLETWVNATASETLVLEMVGEQSTKRGAQIIRMFSTDGRLLGGFMPLKGEHYEPLVEAMRTKVHEMLNLNFGD